MNLSVSTVASTWNMHTRDGARRIENALCAPRNLFFSAGLISGLGDPVSNEETFRNWIS